MTGSRRTERRLGTAPCIRHDDVEGMDADRNHFIEGPRLSRPCRQASRRCLAAGFGVLWACLCLLAPTAATAQEPDDYRERVSSIDEQIDKLEENYLRPALLRSEFKLETRFNDAKVAYLMEDYSRAAVLFFGLVDREEAERLDSYREALYLLGDSLYQERNYLAARKYFEKVIDRGKGSFYQESVAKLLELSARTNNHEGLEDLYETLDEDADVSPAVHYMRGKLLHDQGDFGQARRFFQKAARDDEYALRADYYRGVSFAADEQLANARQVFEKVIDEYDADDERAREILDLSHLALGRLAYEQQDYEQAIDHYQRLERESEHFDQMLYEMAWTFIAQENFEAASRVTDIFLYTSNPEPTFVPRVQLLRADLLLRLQKYDRSKESYQEVLDSFGPVAEELDEFAEDERDLDRFFEDLVDAEMRGERPDYMPRMVKEWVEENSDLEEARLTVDDLSAAREEIEASQRDIEQMEARLESGAEIESFPELAEGMTLGVELENRLIALRRDMIEAEHEMFSSSMNEAQREEWEALSEEVEQVRERYEEIPKTSTEVRQRRQRVEQRFSDLKSELDRVEFEIDAQQEQLDAVDDYLDDPDRHDLSDEDLDKIEEKRAEARRTLEELRELQSQLHSDVEVARQRVGMGDETTRREQKVRREYSELLEQQREFLEELGSDNPRTDREQVDRIQAAREQIPGVERKLQGFFGRMDELVGQRTEELREDLDNERKFLAMLDEEITRLSDQSRQVTAQVAQRSFERVRSDFEDLMMRGDIGLIDVAWQKKEDVSDEINELFEERSAELESLQESFEEVR